MSEPVDSSGVCDGCGRWHDTTQYVSRGPRLCIQCRDRVVACPHCHQICRFDFCDGDGHLVTYWGDEDHDYNCPHCGRGFRVRESVTRSYEVIR